MLVVFMSLPIPLSAVQNMKQINIQKNYKVCKGSDSDMKFWRIKYYSRKACFFKFVFKMLLKEYGIFPRNNKFFCSLFSELL